MIEKMVKSVILFGFSIVFFSCSSRTLCDEVEAATKKLQQFYNYTDIVCSASGNNIYYAISFKPREKNDADSIYSPEILTSKAALIFTNEIGAAAPIDSLIVSITGKDGSDTARFSYSDLLLTHAYVVSVNQLLENVMLNDYNKAAEYIDDELRRQAGEEAVVEQLQILNSESGLKGLQIIGFVYEGRLMVVLAVLVYNDTSTLAVQFTSEIKKGAKVMGIHPYY